MLNTVSDTKKVFNKSQLFGFITGAFLSWPSTVRLKVQALTLALLLFSC